MNKQDIIDSMAEYADIPKTTAAKALDGFVTAVSQTLQEGGKVSIHGFGNFETSFRPERQGRNPRTGEAITISAATMPKFKPAKALKDQVNTETAGA